VRWQRLIAGVFVGFAARIAVDGIGLLILRIAWSACEIAEPNNRLQSPHPNAQRR